MWEKNDFVLDKKKNIFNVMQCYDLPRNKLIRWAFRAIFGMHHKQHVWEAGPKVRPIGMMMPR